MRRSAAFIVTILATLSYYFGTASAFNLPIAHFPYKRHSTLTSSLSETSNVWNSKVTSKSSLEEAEGALYRQSIFPKEEWNIIIKEVDAIKRNGLHVESSSIAQQRLGAALQPDSDTVRLLREGSLCQWVQRMTGDSTMQLSKDLPVEVRSYEQVGAAMAWHVDDVLYEPSPQVEVVVTLENTSDCVTMWKGKTKLHSKETDPNSALLLQAGGPLHCVTSLKRGKRIILKCAYVSSQSSYRQDLHLAQFQTSKNQGKKNKSAKSRRR